MFVNTDEHKKLSNYTWKAIKVATEYMQFKIKFKIFKIF